MSFEVKVSIILLLVNFNCINFGYFNEQKKFSARSDRVKSIDIHPTEPWILASLYNGNVFIYNYQTQVRMLYSDFKSKIFNLRYFSFRL